MPSRETTDQITIPCGHCAGAGTVPLPAYLSTTLEDLTVLHHGDGPVAAHQMLERAESQGRPIKLPALCNRLRTLERLGLVAKVKSAHPTGGAWHLWYPIEPIGHGEGVES